MAKTIVNLYYADLSRAVAFCRGTLGFPVPADLGWAVLFGLRPGSFGGLVDGARSYLRSNPRSAVLVTLVTDDLGAWRERFRAAGAKGRTVIERREDLGIERFFCRDPSGYAVGVQRFFRPWDRLQFRGEVEGGAPC